MPDFELLLLCDSVIMDRPSFYRLTQRPTRPYSTVADTFSALHQEGRIELVDFESILEENGELLSRMMSTDMKLVDHWVEPLKESLSKWRHFSEKSMELMRDAEPEDLTEADFIRTALAHEVGHMMIRRQDEAMAMTQLVQEALGSTRKRKRKEYRGPLREVLRAYLSYINSNLIIANDLNVGFHDWFDFVPFYSKKFLSVGIGKNDTEEDRKQVERLFRVPFPDFAIRSTSALIKAVNDKRIEDLRQLVREAVQGKVVFDEKFAKTVLLEVFQSGRVSGKWRNVLGYVTLPIGFIPWLGTPTQKVIEEGVGRSIDKKYKSKHRWFYMLSEIAESERRTTEQMHAPKPPTQLEVDS